MVDCARLDCGERGPQIPRHISSPECEMQMSHKPLCFILMPFGKKPSGSTHVIDFDAVYRELISPAVEQAGLEPLRADEEEGAGIIHKPMFERLVLCDYAVADLTTANANVFYELGVRHAAKPRTTVLLYAEGQGRLPFDVAMLRAIPYKIGTDGKPADASACLAQLKARLETATRGTDKDSPVFQLLEDYPNVQHEKTDVFRERVAYSIAIKNSLREARRIGRDAILKIEQACGPVVELEAGVAVDLLLSYRAVNAWADIVLIVSKLNPILADTVLVQEQLAFALNRLGQAERAERVLTDVIAKHGPSSETLGILGRVYKDRWMKARASGETARANGLLRKVVETYRKGFEADWRDAYPGINALTFMQVQNSEDPEFDQLRPVVSYAVERKIASGQADYWDFATRLELAVLTRDAEAATKALGDALAHQRESWEAQTTLNNLRLIRQAWPKADPASAWCLEIEEQLANASPKP